MKKHVVFFALSLAILCAPSFADLYFKMDASKTNLMPNETATVTLSAWVDDSAASATNGLDYWSLSAIVDTSGVVEVVDGTINLLAPIPTSSFNLDWNSVNQDVNGSGGTGSIEYLNVEPASALVASDTGYGGFTPIAEFDIRAIGAVNDSVVYTLGDTNGFSGILADGTTIFDSLLNNDVFFDAGSSQNVITIVPEPSSLLILSGLSLLGLRRRKKV